MVYATAVAPRTCPTCRKTIVPVDAKDDDRPKVLGVVPCTSGDGSELVLGACNGGDSCQFAQIRTMYGRVLGEVHFRPGAIVLGGKA